MKTTSLLTLAPTALLCALCALSASAQQRVDQRRWASPEGTVEINNLSGSVRVVGWTDNEVHVTGMLGEGVERLEFLGDSLRTDIWVVLPKNGRNVEDSDLEVQVPEGSRVKVKTVGADVDVSKVTGILDLSSVGGDIRVTGSPKEIEASSVGGEVMLSVSSPRVRVKTVGGRITLRETSGDVEASTVGGGVFVRGGRFKKGGFSTVNGHIQFEGDLTPNGVFHFEGVNGTFDLLLPASVKARFQISARDIKNEFGPEAEPASGYGPPIKRLNFSTGSGGASVSISTFNGTVSLRKK